jgi:hypothetical protein
VLFTFPSRYWFTIGHQGYLALESGLPSFPRDSTCPVVLRIPAGVSRMSPTGLSPALAARSRSLRLSGRLLTPMRRSYNPAPTRRTVWAAPRSLAATGGIVSFPRGTEMFQFPRFPRAGLCVQPAVTRDEAGRVAPFGDPGLSLLDSWPGLFAVLPRPSSAPDAKASTVRPW